MPADDRNLACRAARAFLQRAGLRAAVEIDLVKRIPTGAGLGGGSSDAGTVLRALGRLVPGALDAGTTRALALTLGADVPYFLDPRPALVAGIGEQIEPVGPLPKLAFALAHPGISLSTAQVYAAWDALAPALTRPAAGSTLRALSDLGSSDPSDRSRFAERLGTLITNDLEAAAVRLCPPIRRLEREIAAEGALATGMSGSGATVYGVFASEEEAAAAVRHVGARTSASGWVRLAAIGGAR